MYRPRHFFFFLMIRRPPRSTLFPYHDALPIYTDMSGLPQVRAARAGEAGIAEDLQVAQNPQGRRMLTAHAPVAPLGWLVFADRKSTRLNSSHANISYAVFCLKKKKNIYLSSLA